MEEDIGPEQEGEDEKDTTGHVEDEEQPEGEQEDEGDEPMDDDDAVPLPDENMPEDEVRDQKDTDQADPNAEAGFFNEEEDAVADMIVVETLRRQKTMGLREYLTQLSYLGLINPPSAGQDFLTMYEKARFCGRPSSEAEFNRLMAVFAQLLEGMTELHPDIVAEIRAQASSEDSSSDIENNRDDSGRCIHGNYEGS